METNTPGGNRNANIGRLYVISYDIPDNRRRRRLHRFIEPYRIDGQKSVHEVILRKSAIIPFVSDLIHEVDEDSDSLIGFRVRSHRKSPQILALHNTDSVYGPLYNYHQTIERLSGGLYVSGYDIQSNRTRRKIQKILDGIGVSLQRSVHLIQGNQTTLIENISLIRDHLDEFDDFRLYRLNRRADLSCFCGELPVHIDKMVQ